MDEKKYLAESSKYVVKSNDLIQKSRFKLSLQQQKMVLYIVSQIRKDDTDLQTYTFQIADFCRVCGLNNIGGTNYQLLKEALETLKQKTLWIQQDEDAEILVSWLGAVKTHPKGGTVDLGLDPALKPYLLNLQSRFTRFQLEKVLSLRRKYSPRLYEILKSYLHESEDEHSEVFDFEKILYWLDLQDTIYKEYKYLNRDILAPSIAEIRRKTDITVEYKPVRTKHKVTGISFNVKRNSTQDRVSASLETRAIFVAADAPNKAKKGKKQLVKSKTQIEQKPSESSDSQQKKDDVKPVSITAEQQTEQELPERIQVRIYKGKKLLKAPSKKREQREQLDAIVKKFLLDNNLQPLQPFEHSEGASFRVDCK